MEVLNRNHKFNNKSCKSFREYVLTKIARTLEKKFGRDKPIICELPGYKWKNIEINEDSAKKKHFPNCVSVLLNGIQGVDQVNLEKKDLSLDNAKKLGSVFER